MDNVDQRTPLPYHNILFYCKAVDCNFPERAVVCWTPRKHTLDMAAHMFSSNNNYLGWLSFKVLLCPPSFKFQSRLLMELPRTTSDRRIYMCMGIEKVRDVQELDLRGQQFKVMSGLQLSVEEVRG